jgi:transcriptional regulator with XRE-family HTH domain
MPRARHIPKTDPRLIRYARYASRLTQAEVAHRIGMNTSEVTRWELGNRQPGPDALLRLANALGVPWSDLIDDATLVPAAVPVLGEPSAPALTSLAWGQSFRVLPNTCGNGHPYDDENLYLPPAPGAGRQCRQCVRDAGARYRKRQRALRIKATA